MTEEAKRDLYFKLKDLIEHESFEVINMYVDSVFIKMLLNTDNKLEHKRILKILCDLNRRIVRTASCRYKIDEEKKMLFDFIDEYFFWELLEYKPVNKIL